VEPLPDLAALSDQELKELIRDLVREESEVSYRRRILHGKIDILRAELVARLQRSVQAGESPISHADVEKLTEVLASKSTPSGEDDLE
jgi:anti-sigma-K factor RsiG